MSDSGYGVLDRFLHRLALEYNSIAQISFDLDQRMVRTDPADIISNRHVFVAGLARAGTTVLMRKFHDTGYYRSLTYRDMPFVLAPTLWRRLAAISKREIESAERAHGDNVFVDLDSPESFEDVFWRVFAGDEYLKADRLIPHEPDREVIQQFTHYVNAILSANGPRRERYLSKNNNNILRLGAIRQAFPKALILVPFREPLQQAQSLFRQHRRFLEMQESDRFTLSFMTWLSHHEFGLDHRPFRFGGAVVSATTADTLNYWLNLWCEVYGWLEKAKPSSAVFICYEDLCTDVNIWPRVAELAEISVGPETGDPFKLKTTPVDADIDPALMDRAGALYRRLTMNARDRLS